jgi:hypothetical protein
MANRNEQIMQELSPYFQEWTKDFQDFILWQHYGILESESDKIGLWDFIEYLYEVLFEAMIKMSRIKDQWVGPEHLPLAVKAGHVVYFRSEKLEFPFHFGTDELGFFISADLMYSEYIRKMDDNFWFLLIELTQYGKLEFLENRIFPDSQEKKEPWFHRKTNSAIFQLIRNAVAWEKEDGAPEGLGMLIVRWKYEISWEKLLLNGSLTLKNLYQINQALKKKHR